MTSSDLKSLGVEATQNQLRAASQRAALVTLLGASLVFGSLLYAGVSLRSTHLQLDVLQVERLQVMAQIEQNTRVLATASDELEETKLQLRQARCALESSRSAVQAFHQRQYSTAVELYSEALTCDPGNAYILNLQAYSLFKLGRLEDAIRSQQRSLASEPDYAWGYFDLARFLCASGTSRLVEARSNIDRAVRLRPNLGQIMQGDGEFVRLCGEMVPGNSQ